MLVKLISSFFGKRRMRYIQFKLNYKRASHCPIKGFEMIAYRGLNGSQCDAYLAMLESSDTKRKTTARRWSWIYKAEILPEQLNKISGFRKRSASTAGVIKHFSVYHANLDAKKLKQ
jgi:hypothetical protein